MSQETSQWIHEKFLSGMEATHGKPWWSDPTKDNPANHFDGPIPIEAIEKLFGFDVFLSRVWCEDKDGNLFLAEDFVGAVPDNQQAVYGIHSKSYSEKGHQFRQWLIDGPAKLINGNVGVSNAGLLKNGAQAWVNISTPTEWKTPQGVDFRPNLLFTTAWDGSIKSTAKETDTMSVCDNTRERALNGAGLVYAVKHTKNSEFRLEDAKGALHLLEDNANAFAEEVKTLCEWPVSDYQFEQFLSQLVPMPDVKDHDINKRDYSTRSATIAANKRDKLNELYRLDGRAAPWKGTAFGVLQSVNTYNTHLATQRNVVDHRAARNMENVITGKTADLDLSALLLLSKITGRELVAA